MMAYTYNRAKLYPFVASLRRTGYEGDILMGWKNDLKDMNRTADILEKFKVKILWNVGSAFGVRYTSFEPI